MKQKMIPTIVLVGDKTDQAVLLLKEVVSSLGYVFKRISEVGNLFSFLRKSGQVSLIIVDVRTMKDGVRSLYKSIKANPLTADVPLIILGAEDEAVLRKKIAKIGADDYLVEPIEPSSTKLRLETMLRWSDHPLYVNPLTNLPGNIFLNREIDIRIQKNRPFSICCIDLNHFKAFNDWYGYKRGDEVIKMTAHILAEKVKSYGGKDDIVGHIGGDDFITVTIPAKAKLLARQIIAMFDRHIPLYYDRTDWNRGYIVTESRTGTTTKYPLMSISVVIISSTKYRKLRSTVQIAEIATELKSYAKSLAGSQYVEDRRGIRPSRFKRRKIEKKVIERKPLLFQTEEGEGYIIGIDVRLSGIAGVLVDMHSRIISRIERDTVDFSTKETLTESIRLAVIELMKSEKVNVREVKGIGISMPGIIDSDRGKIIYSYFLNKERNIPLRLLLEHEFQIPIFLDNDARVRLLGELWLSKDRIIRNFNDVIYVLIKVYARTIGMGCSFMLNGQVYKGATQSSGELALRDTKKGQESVGTDELFPLSEALPPLSVLADKMMKEGAHSKFLKGKKITNTLVIEAAEKGDKLSIVILRELAILIGRRCASLVNLLNPELIVIGGDIGGAGKLFLKPFVATIRNLAFDTQLSAVDIRLSRLKDQYAGALGATVLVT